LTKRDELIVAKKKFVLRIDEEVYDALEQWAAADFRSVNGQIEWLLTRALRDHKRLPAGKEPPGAGAPDEADN
jgi:hypothetical protein